MVEEFRSYNDRIEVSNLGTVKRDGEIIEPYHSEYYDYIVIGGEVVRVHIMVGELFPEICGEHDKRMNLHHVNHNPRDNRASNLVWLLPSAHRRLHQSEDGISVGVKAYDQEGNYIGQWESKTQAARETGVDYRHISEVVNGSTYRKTAGGYVWFKVNTTEEDVDKVLGPIMERYMEEMEARKAKEEMKKELEERRASNQAKREDRRVRKIEAKKIYEFNDRDEFVREWKDIKDAAKFHEVTIGAIYMNLRGDTVYMKKDGKKWYFKKKSACQP